MPGGIATADLAGRLRKIMGLRALPSTCSMLAGHYARWMSRSALIWAALEAASGARHGVPAVTCAFGQLAW